MSSRGGSRAALVQDLIQAIHIIENLQSQLSKQTERAITAERRAAALDTEIDMLRQENVKGGDAPDGGSVLPARGPLAREEP